MFAIFVADFNNANAVTRIYVEDWNATLFDSADQPYFPEQVRLINERVALFGESEWRGGDVALLDGPRSCFYWGMGNINFNGVLNSIDEDNEMQYEERNFFHSTDPSALTGWGTGSGVELRWMPDLRDIQARNDLGGSEPIHESPRYVYEYRVLRGTTPSGLQEIAVVDTVSAGGIDELTSFFDAGAISGSYYYAIRSVLADGSVREYTLDPIIVSTAADNHPHFWAVRGDHQERIYAEDSGETEWPFVFRADAPIEPDAGLTLEIYQQYDGIDDNGQDPAYQFDVTGDFDESTLTCTFVWDISDLPTDSDSLAEYFSQNGAMFYRLVYERGSARFVCPAEHTVEYDSVPYTIKHFHSSGFNNRTMGGGWKEYLANTNSPTWQQACVTAVSKIKNGNNGMGIAYDGVFFDTVDIADADIHCEVRPIELVSMPDYHTEVIALMGGVLDFVGSSDFDVYVNTTELDFLEHFKNDSRLTGSMLENGTSYPVGVQALGEGIRRARGMPDLDTIIRDQHDWTATSDGRLQALSLYLMCRSHLAAEDNLLFGCKFEDRPDHTVAIVPEELLIFGDEIGDVYANVEVWPSPSDFLPANPDSAADPENYIAMQQWVNSNASPLSVSDGSYYFLVRKFMLEDGLEGVATDATMAAVAWYLGDGSEVQVSATELLGDTDEDWYELQVDAYDSASPEDRILVSQGARLWSELVATDMTFDNFIGGYHPTMRVFFNKPVHSPSLQEQPVTLQSTPGIPIDIAVEASQWNGEELDTLRVDGSSIGLVSEMVFTFSDADGLYHYDYDEQVSPGFVYGGFLPAVLKGTDGLVYCGELEVQIESTDEPDLTIAEQAAYLIPDSEEESAIFAVQIDVDEGGAPVGAAYADLQPFGGQSMVTLGDTGENGDIAPNDGIWSVTLDDPIVERGTTYEIEVTVRDTEWNVARRMVQATVASEVVDQGPSTGALKDLAGTPSSVAAFDLVDGTTDGSQEILVTADGEVGQLFKAVPSPSESQSFSYSTDEYFESGGRIPSGAASILFADINNDGHEDFFYTLNQAPALFVWNPDIDKFQPESEMFLDYAPESVYAAAWGDYNRDAWIDLVLICSFAAGAAPDGYSPGTINLAVYRNSQGRFEHSNAIPVELGSGAAIPTELPALGVTLGYVNGDMLLDAVVTDVTTLDGSLRVAINQGFVSKDSDFGFADLTGAWFGKLGDPAGVVSSKMADLDNDGLFDLVLARQGQDDNLRFYRNLGTHYEAAEWKETAVTEDLAGIAIGDLDLNGWIDVLTVPGEVNQVATGAPRLLLNHLVHGTRLVEHPELNIPEAPTAGVVAFDWVGDKPSLYLGRVPAGPQLDEGFFYSFPKSQAADYLRLQKAHSTGLVNGSGIGTKIAATYTVDGERFTQTRVVSGNGGPGGADLHTLVYGFGKAHSGATVDLTVVWPDSTIEQNEISMPYNSSQDPTTIYEVSALNGQTFSVLESSLSASFQVGAEDNWWVFEWDADYQTRPEVEVWLDASAGPACDCLGSRNHLVLDPATVSGVELSVTPTSTGLYRHRVTWKGLCCALNCKLHYEARSELNGIMHVVGDGFAVSPKRSCPFNP